MDLSWSEVLILGVIIVLLTGWLAGRKGRSPLPWAGLAVLLGPLALLLVALLPHERASVTAE